MLKKLHLSLLITALGTPVFAADLFIDNAKIVTNTVLGTVDNADIIVRDGRIATIGEGLTAPRGATVINGKGQWVTPGIFTPFARMGLVEIGLEAATNDIHADKSETSVSDLASDSFNPKAPALAVTRVEGITHAAIAPGAGKTIFGGIGFIANTTGGFDSVVKDNAFVYVQMGEGGARLAGGSRAASFSQLRAALDDANAYPSRYDSPSDGDTLSRRDASALAKAARGGMPIMIWADRAADMLKIVELKADYDQLDIIIVGATDGWLIADQIAAANIKVMIDPHENLPSSFDAVGSRLDNVLLLDAAGVDYAIMSRTQDPSHNSRVLPQHAGNAVGSGLEWNKAFAAISSTPARWFGLDEGTLKTGSDTLVIWDGDPLEVVVSPTHMVIDGNLQAMESRQTKLRDRYNPTATDSRPFKYRE